MKRIRNLKRVLGVLLTGLLGINAMGFSAIAENNSELISTTDIFTWVVYENIAYPESLVEDYQTILNNTTEIKMPETYTENGITYPVNEYGEQRLFQSNDYFTKIVFPQTYTQAASSLFRNCSSIQEITYEYNGSSFKIASRAFNNCTSLKKLYINTDTIIIDSSNAFTGVNSNVIAYVKNESCKTTLESYNWPGNIEIVKNDKPELNSTTDIFTWMIYENVAYPESLVEDYQTILNNITEMKMPETYTENGVTYPVNEYGEQRLFQSNDYFTKIVFPQTYTQAASSLFRNCSSIQDITYEYNGSPFKIASRAFNNCTSLKGLYIYADSITIDSSNAFTGINSDAVAYVKNENCKSTLESYNWPGSIVIDTEMGNETSKANKISLSFKIDEVESFLSGIDKTKYTNIEALETELENAKAVYNNGSATQEEVNNATNLLAAAFDNVEEIVDKTALNEKIEEISAYRNGLGLERGLYTGWDALSRAHNSAVTVNGKDTATQAEVNKALEELNTAYSNIKLKTTNVIELKNALVEANNFVKGKTNTDYDNLSNLNDIASSSATVYYSETATQDEIDKAYADLIAAQAAVTKRNASDIIAEMNEIIAEFEALNKNDYTEDSWLPVETAISKAKAINDGLRSEYIAVISELKTAKTGLELKPENYEIPGDPIAIINKNAVETKIADFTADEETAEATKIRITFDCASDVSFNQYASIEMKANIAGTESYMKFVGTDTTETAGAKGFAIELPLSNAINSGDDVKLVAYTWAWSNASDYVYGITKVEYINAVGQVVKAVTDRTIALDDLKAAIAEAEKIESANYTEESFAKLTDALTAAKELPDEAEKADIEVVKTALETAVAGLVEKTDDSSSEPTPDSESEPDSKPDSESSSDTDADSSSKTDSKTDNSSSKTDESNSSTTKTDSASSNSNANTTSNANSGANGSSNPNTGATSAAAAGIILLSAIGVITRKK